MREEEMIFCGTGSFKDVDKEKIKGAQPEAGKTKKIKSPDAGKKKTKKKENPYASRGLDKFSTVLAELESRREKVLRRVEVNGDGDRRVMVRFVQSGAKGWVPIVVKLPPDQEQPAAKVDSKKNCCKSPATAAVPAAAPAQPSMESASASPRGDVAVVAAAKAAPAKKTAGAVERWRPSQYWPFVAVLLLAGLVVFGRVFAICCTSVWWYLVPILSGEEGGQRRSMGNKIGKKVGEKLTWASLPPSHGKRSATSGAHEVISPRSHRKVKKG